MNDSPTPNLDCPICDGEGVDADPHGLFDGKYRKPCPYCFDDSFIDVSSDGIAEEVFSNGNRRLLPEDWDRDNVFKAKKLY